MILSHFHLIIIIFSDRIRQTLDIDGVIQYGVVGGVVDAGCSDVDVFDEGARVGVKHHWAVDSGVVEEVKVISLLIVARRVAHVVVWVNDLTYIMNKKNLDQIKILV